MKLKMSADSHKKHPTAEWWETNCVLVESLFSFYWYTEFVHFFLGYILLIIPFLHYEYKHKNITIKLHLPSQCESTPDKIVPLSVESHIYETHVVHKNRKKRGKS